MSDNEVQNVRHALQAIRRHGVDAFDKQQVQQVEMKVKQLCARGYTLAELEGEPNKEGGSGSSPQRPNLDSGDFSFDGGQDMNGFEEFMKELNFDLEGPGQNLNFNAGGLDQYSNPNTPGSMNEMSPESFSQTSQGGSNNNATRASTGSAGNRTPRMSIPTAGLEPVHEEGSYGKMRTPRSEKRLSRTMQQPWAARNKRLSGDLTSLVSPRGPPPPVQPGAAGAMRRGTSVPNLIGAQGGLPGAGGSANDLDALLYDNVDLDLLDLQNILGDQGLGVAGGPSNITEELFGTAPHSARGPGERVRPHSIVGVPGHQYQLQAGGLQPRGSGSFPHEQGAQSPRNLGSLIEQVGVMGLNNDVPKRGSQSGLPGMGLAPPGMGPGRGGPPNITTHQLAALPPKERKRLLKHRHKSMPDLVNLPQKAKKQDLIFHDEYEKMHKKHGKKT